MQHPAFLELHDLLPPVFFFFLANALFPRHMTQIWVTSEVFHPEVAGAGVFVPVCQGDVAERSGRVRRREPQ